MSDKSDTPRTDERCAAIMAWQAKESDWPDFARQLERELSKAADLLRAHADALEENARLRADNDTLRGLLGNSALPCPYCGLAAEDQSKCAHGFPGCARADDQMLSKHFADGYRAERAEAELAKLRQKLMRYEHAEAADILHPPQDEQARADFPEEK